MFASKRRPASTQAVSRQVEGIEPRHHEQQEGRRRRTGWQSTRAQPEWRGNARFLGVRDQGMCDTKTTRQPGRPCRCFPEKWAGEYAKQPHQGREANQRQGVGSSHSTEEGGSGRWREGDDKGSSRGGRHQPHTEAENRWKRNDCASRRTRMTV